MTNERCHWIRMTTKKCHMVQGPQQCGYSAVQLIQLHDFDWLINITYEDEYFYPKFQRSFNKQTNVNVSSGAVFSAQLHLHLQTRVCL